MRRSTVVLALGLAGIALLRASAEWVTRPAVAAPTTVSAAGVLLRSVSVDLPDSDRSFPEGAGADAVNNNCLACHSAGMVLTQPSLSRVEWQAEVDKMRAVYKAPIATEDVAAIVDYLTRLRSEN